MATSAAQIVAPSDTIASPKPGVGHDYIKMLNETVNPESGAVNFNISIPTPPGRGLNFPFSIQYNSNQVLFLTPAFQNLYFGLQWFNGIGEFDQGAWSYGVPILSRKPYVYNVTWDPQGDQIKCAVVDSYMFTALDGSQHPEALANIYDDAGATPSGDACTNAEWHSSVLPTGSPYSAALAGGPSNPPDNTIYTAAPTDGGTPTVTAPDGTTYVWQNGLDPACTETSLFCFGNPPSLIEDRNGNKINLQVTTSQTPAPQPGFVFNYALSVTDTVGRPLVTTTNFGQDGSKITVAGDPAPYILHWQNFTYSGNYSLNVQNNSILPQDCPTPSPYLPGQQTENVISSIQLPNGQSYSFTYDTTYGTISSITYPSGAVVSYTYGIDPISSNVNFNGSTEQVHPLSTIVIPGACSFRTDAVAVTERDVKFDGTTVVQRQQFAYGPTTWGSGNGALWARKSTTVTTTDNVTGSSFTTAYQYVSQPDSSGVNFSNSFADSVENVITTKQGSATPSIVNKAWFGNHVACEIDTFGNSSSAKYYRYSAALEITDIKEFDYGLITPGGCYNTPNLNDNSGAANLNPPQGITPSRETTVSYQVFATAPDLADMPCWIKKQDGSGNLYAETDYFYDGAVSTGCPTLSSASTTTTPVSNLPPNTHDELGYGPNSSTSRGNATAVIEKCLYGGCAADSTTTLKYDETGQIISITDPCGFPGVNCADVTGSNHTTLYSYQDSPIGGNQYGNSNAFLTQITYPSAPATLQKKFTYNYPSGELASSIDENNQQTNYTYNDPLLRPTEIQGPPDPNNGNQRPTTTYSYNDSAPNPTVATSELINSSGTWKTSVAVMDGMRHIIHTQLTSDPDGTDFVDTVYNGMGQVYSQSNPHRSTSSPTDGISYSYYDALGRTVLQVHPDGTGLTWCYNDIPAQLPSWVNNFSQPCNGHLGLVSTGTWVDGTDELSNDWQRTSDSFGNLTEVMEPNGSTKTPSMETDYCYNAHNDLTYVMQSGGSAGTFNCAKLSPPAGAHTRSFAYDSLSRLTSATNPETGMISYIYDLNGNVSAKTDARGISVNYSYDNLNRLYQKAYKTGSANTSDPIVCMQYDSGSSGATSPLGRLTMDWTQPAGTSCSGPASPQQKPPSNSISSRIISGYDVMGRLNGDQQCPLGSCATPYPFNYSYDLAGDPIQAILPISGGNSLTLASTWDSAQRPSAINVTGQPSGWNTSAYLNRPTLLQAAATTGYDPVGNLVKANLGVTSTEPNGVANILRAFDNRARITSETDGGNVVNTPATQSTGSIALSGSEASGSTQGTSGSGVLSVSGVDGQQYECTTTYEWINAGDNGEVYEPVTTCDYVPDTGTLAVTIDGFTSTANYSSSSTDAALASVLAAGFNLNGSPVRAVASGNSFTVTAVATGTSSNYPITISNGDFTVSDPSNVLTGGTNGSTVYDAGTVTATITNNSVSPAANYTTSAVSWGQGSTTSTLASSLASAINSAAGTIVTATVNGSSVQLASTATGPTTNYSVSVSASDSQTASYPSLFPSASFQASATSMTGGKSLTSSFGTVYSYAVPAGGYAANGNLLTYNDSTVMGTWNFGYDTLNRLTAGNATAGAYSGLQASWSYDAFGNRTAENFGGSTSHSMPTSSTASYNASNKVSASSLMLGGPLGYDLAGNVNQDSLNSYAYDGEGRLCAVGNASGKWGYLYNAEGIRIAKGTVATVACPNSASSFISVTEQYLLDQNGDQVTELNSSGWAHTNIFAGGTLDATYDGQGLHFHLKDPLGTRRVQLAAGSGPNTTPGCVENTFQSLPSGNNLTANPNPTCGSGDDPTEHHFTGKERDTETGEANGNDYFGARYYASSMGRWLSPDPAKLTFKHLANPQKWNKYNYVLNNPLAMFDPDGQQEVTVTYRAFIPQASVAGFRGDNRNFSASPDASSRVSVTVRIETDPTKNGGNPLIGKPVVVVQSTHIQGTPESLNKTSDGPKIPIPTVTQDKNGTVNISVNMDMRDPFQPAGQGAASNVNISVNEAGTTGEVKGTVSGSPSFETNFTPQGGPTTNLPVQAAPQSTVGFLVGLERTNIVDKKTDIKQAQQ